MEEKNISIDREDIFEIEDPSSGEEITTPFSPNDIKLSTPPMNMGDIIDMIQYKYIDFDTDYQRNENLWTDEQQSRLIESILLGLRLPAFYFESVTKKQYKIIDGLQRCCAIRNFCVDETLELHSLEFLKQFNNKKYSDFPFDIKREIRMLPVTVNVLENGTPDRVKYILFKRLNTGGIKLSPQEIRNAIFMGKAIDVVKAMAKYPSFIKATLGKIPTIRKQDQDFVSRFVAFYLFNYKLYKPDLDNFINSVMEDVQAGKYDDQLEQMKQNFNKSMTLAYTIFGDDAFRKRDDVNATRKPLNKAYFEVIAVNFSKLTDYEIKKLLDNKELFKENLIFKMNSDTAYNNSFSGGTGKRDSVIKRFSVFNEILVKSINGIRIE